MEKKIITDKDRIAKLKERRAFLNDQIKSMNMEVRALKKEVRAEQFVNGSLRSVIYGSSPFYGVFQITTLLNWVESLIREKQNLQDLFDEERESKFDKQAKKYNQDLKNQFTMKPNPEFVSQAQWIFSFN